LIQLERDREAAGIRARGIDQAPSP
jgi:hypothetical protein